MRYAMQINQFVPALKHTVDQMRRDTGAELPVFAAVIVSTGAKAFCEFLGDAGPKIM
jgi:hypothetical protein